ncbi:hypothetical protein EHM76_01510 [bacterium]|nr:MAG: hypothetical protein EHM76_01510 [bacterium]
MNKLELDPTLPFNQKLQAWYNHLDAFIGTEEKDKTPKDFAVWAEEVNQAILLPLEKLLNEQFKNDAPVKVQLLDAKPKVKKDDHLKRLKTLRYNIFTYQRKAYLEEIGDLS